MQVDCNKVPFGDLIGNVLPNWRYISIRPGYRAQGALAHEVNGKTILRRAKSRTGVLLASSVDPTLCAQLIARLASDHSGHDLAFGLANFKNHLRELGRATHVWRFHEDVMGLSDLRSQMSANLSIS